MSIDDIKEGMMYVWHGWKYDDREDKDVVFYVYSVARDAESIAWKEVIISAQQNSIYYGDCGLGIDQAIYEDELPDVQWIKTAEVRYTYNDEH